MDSPIGTIRGYFDCPAGKNVQKNARLQLMMLFAYFRISQGRLKKANALSINEVWLTNFY